MFQKGANLAAMLVVSRYKYPVIIDCVAIHETHWDHFSLFAQMVDGVTAFELRTSPNTESLQVDCLDTIACLAKGIDCRHGLFSHRKHFGRPRQGISHCPGDEKSFRILSQLTHGGETTLCVKSSLRTNACGTCKHMASVRADFDLPYSLSFSAGLGLNCANLASI